MDKPTPDGSLVIYFTVASGQLRPHHYPFDEIESHYVSPEGYTIRLQQPGGMGYIKYNQTHILAVSVVQNSTEYIKKLKAWADAAHPEHEATDKLDSKCRYCQPILQLRAEMGMGSDDA